jgi:hypothetical protein
MATNNRTPEAEGLEVVVVGSFNPAIFHPEWFLRQKLAGEDDVKEAQVNVVGRDVTDIEICGLKVVCINDRFSLATANISHAAKMQDFLLHIFALLPHTPVTACGINSFAHYLIGDTQYWNKIGHTLVPKELIWNGLLEKPGMQSVIVKGLRKGDFPGEINIRVEPSQKIQPGLYVLSNYHYQMADAAIDSDTTEKLLNFLKAEWKSALEKARIVADEILLKIRPDDGEHS